MRMGHFVNFKEELKRRTEEAEHVIREYLPEESGFADVYKRQLYGTVTEKQREAVKNELERICGLRKGQYQICLLYTSRCV